VRSLDPIRTALARAPARTLSGKTRAAVAVVLLDQPADAELLLIERAERTGDPWSGHMAFPGGRVNPKDRDVQAAAERETREEVGLDLAGAELLGRLDDLQGGNALRGPLVLSAFVYRLAARPLLVAQNDEVQATLWVPLGMFFDPARHVGHTWGGFKMPGVLVGEPGRHVVWGLTYRLLDSLFTAAGSPLPTQRGGSRA